MLICSSNILTHCIILLEDQSMALSRDDVRKHLEDLGYYNVSDDLLDVFAKGKF